MSIGNYKPKWPCRSYLGPLAKPDKIKPVKLTRRMIVDYSMKHMAAKAGKYLGPLAKPSPVKKPQNYIRSRRPDTAKQDREYNARVQVWLHLPENIYCHCCIARGLTPKRSTQCHHKHGKGSHRELQMVEALWVATCNSCHPNWIHGNPEAARAVGMLAPRGQWNKLPPEMQCCKRCGENLQTNRPIEVAGNFNQLCGLCADDIRNRV
jgi:hypothetical protein